MMFLLLLDQALQKIIDSNRIFGEILMERQLVGEVRPEQQGKQCQAE